MQEEHTGTGPIKSSVLGQEEDESAPPKVLLERTTAIKEVPHAPVNSPASISPADPVKGFVHEQERILGQPEVNLEVPVGLEEDHHAPKDRLVDHAPSNYQTKATDPTGSGKFCSMFACQHGLFGIDVWEIFLSFRGANYCILQEGKRLE
jgi:hypothetical protein